MLKNLQDDGYPSNFTFILCVELNTKDTHARRLFKIYVHHWGYTFYIQKVEVE